ncbi:hypothetical protein JRQ81_000679 [Phrynocephalus forsythii]|uniref:Uncharacterized protein n=1 Tax=Phrynocephalus forsythii TaxID=171643 RepID=A0A9Q1B892_9SAUR|nr:hypothetical protein JRQ81_000679 [Phrynocephalus forsythii]
MASEKHSQRKIGGCRTTSLCLPDVNPPLIALHNGSRVHFILAKSAVFLLPGTA